MATVNIKGDPARLAQIACTIALAEQTKRLADAAWKKIGGEEKKEKEE